MKKNKQFSKIQKCEIYDKMLSIFLHWQNTPPRQHFSHQFTLYTYSDNLKSFAIMHDELKLLSSSKDEIITCIKELNQNGYIFIKLNVRGDISDCFLEYVSELGIMKMHNGGFVKEHNDICDRKREKRINRFFAIATLIVISIYTIYTMLLYYKPK